VTTTMAAGSLYIIGFLSVALIFCLILLAIAIVIRVVFRAVRR
jgi:hypothetical protein